MSGGSYGYLYRREVGELFECDDLDLQRMADRLAGFNASDAARETQDLLLDIRVLRARIEARRDRLAEIWQAVEWVDSGDSNDDAIVTALENYRKKAGKAKP